MQLQLLFSDPSNLLFFSFPDVCGLFQHDVLHDERRDLLDAVVLFKQPPESTESAEKKLPESSSALWSDRHGQREQDLRGGQDGWPQQQREDATEGAR